MDGKGGCQNRGRALVWILLVLLQGGLFGSAVAMGQDRKDDKTESLSQKATKPRVERITILGQSQSLHKMSGSAHRIDKEELENQDYEDINRILRQVPGVNLQEEDGYGLRPNIGLRGVSPHRSRKIVIMEDGVLIGPAPYSAPAAYYFPAVTRLDGVEVFKGPAAIRHGPNSLGGAVNLISHRWLEEGENRVKLKAGSWGLLHQQLTAGYKVGPLRLLVDAAMVQADGFKTLPGGEPTGFKKTDGLVKARWDINAHHSVELKWGQSSEDSHETYLGLARNDFAQDPWQRYAASAEDRMEWQHRQLMLSHDWEGDRWHLATSLYRHDFSRLWSKVSSFNDGTAFRDVLANPVGRLGRYYNILRGEEDALNTGDLLVLGNNDRDYYAQGIQTELSFGWPLAASSHEFRLGLRVHQDGIERMHTSDYLSMTAGSLMPGGLAQEPGTQNKDDTTAIAFWLLDEWSIGRTKLTFGLRAEEIANERSWADDREGSEHEETLIIPGFGVYQELSKEWGALFGVNKGLAPVGPGQADDVKPEESTNFELGVRYGQGSVSAEVIGFYSRYQNLKVVCTLSSGCAEDDLDREFDGAEAEVMGFESQLSTQIYTQSGRIPISANYTYTRGAFSAPTVSDNEEWGVGQILKDDPLPYIPDHQGALRIGWERPSWGVWAAANYMGVMYDQSVVKGRQEVDPHWVGDLGARWYINHSLNMQARVENVADKAYLVSLRPYGRRPGKPRTYQAGVNYLW